MLCFAMGAVVDGVPTTCQTPLSGHCCPVCAVVPNGTLAWIMWFGSIVVSGTVLRQYCRSVQRSLHNHLLRAPRFLGNFPENRIPGAITGGGYYGVKAQCRRALRKS